MRHCIRLAAVVTVLGGCGLGLSGQQTAGVGEPGPKNEQFDRVFAEWAALLTEMRDSKEEYRTADEDRQAEVKTHYDSLVKKGQELQFQLVEAARDAYTETPNADADIAEFLARFAFWELGDDNYENALALAELLIEHEANAPSIYAFAAVAAFATGDLETSARYFKTAEEKDILHAVAMLGPQHNLSDLEGHYAEYIAHYADVWPKEQAIRAAEAEADDLPRVLLQTDKGDIELELFENQAPNTVANFISLVEKGFYDGLDFHRVLPGFMAQGGCPEGTGIGGPGYHIPCECDRPDHRLHFRGSLSMAHAGPDTGGSQFFITFVPTRQLDGKHTVFGRVVDGLDVLAKIRRRDPEQPVPPVPDKIVRAKVLRRRDHAYQPEAVGSGQISAP